MTEEARDPRPLDDWGGLWSLKCWLWVGSLGVAAAIAAAVLILLGGFFWDRDRRVFHRIAAWWGRWCSFTFPGPVEIRGTAILESHPGPFVITPNHQSMVDLLILYFLPLQYRTVVKRSWFLGPYGLNLWAAGYVPTRKSSDPENTRRLMDACERWLQRGISVLIFPEGTRSRTWTLLRFRRGAFDLAARANVPILPVAIAGSNDLSHPSTLRFRYNRGLKLIVEVLPPIHPDGRSAEELKSVCVKVLEGEVAALRDELWRTLGQGPPRGDSDARDTSSVDSQQRSSACSG